MPLYKAYIQGCEQEFNNTEMKSIFYSFIIINVFAMLQMYIYCVIYH